MSKSRLFLTTLGLLCAAGSVSAQSLQLVDDYTVTVQNNRDEDATVYLDVMPFEQPVGTVDAMSTATFSLPDWMVRGEETVKLLVQSPSGHAVRAEGMVRNPDEGTHIALMLPNKESDDMLAFVTSELVGVGPNVTVHNHEGEAAEVFFRSGTHTQRLGRVEGESVMTFQLSHGWAGRSGEVVLAREGAPTLSTAVSFGKVVHVGVLLD